MSQTLNHDNGFGFDLTDEENKTKFRFTFNYDERCDLLQITVATYDQRVVGDDFGEMKPFHTNNQMSYWISPNQAHVLFDGFFWDKVGGTMMGIHAKRVANGDFEDGAGI